MLRTALYALVSLCLLAPPAAQAKSKKGRSKSAGSAKAACGQAYLQLVPGKSWTYEFREEEDAQATPAPDLTPPSVTITVLSAEPGKDGTTVTLEEQHRDFKRQTQVVCTDKEISVSPHSFLFAGQVGGGIGLELSNIKHSGASYPGQKDFKKGTSLTETFEADVTRAVTPDSNAKLPAGWLQIERALNIVGDETIETDTEVFKKALRVEVDISGVAGEESDRKNGVTIGEGTKSVLWLVSGVGVVKAVDPTGKGWLLKKAAAEAP